MCRISYAKTEKRCLPLHRGAFTLRNRVRTSEERLPLEGKLAARKG